MFRAGIQPFRRPRLSGMIAGMKILVIGGARGIGGQAVALGVAREHHMSLLDRAAADFLLAAHPRFQSFPADVLERESLPSAINGQDAVLLCLGARSGAGEARRLEDGTAAVLAAMKAAGVSRLVAVTGLGAEESLAGAGFVFRRILTPLLYRPLFARRVAQEELIRRSGLDWSILRPAFLAPGTRSGRVCLDRNWQIAPQPVCRADVAEAALHELEHGEWRGQACRVALRFS